MKRPDLVLFLIPATYVLVGLGLLPLEVNVYNAMVYASSLVSVIIAQALFIDPPG